MKDFGKQRVSSQFVLIAFFEAHNEISNVSFSLVYGSRGTNKPMSCEFQIFNFSRRSKSSSPPLPPRFLSFSHDLAYLSTGQRLPSLYRCKRCLHRQKVSDVGAHFSESSCSSMPSGRSSTFALITKLMMNKVICSYASRFLVDLRELKPAEQLLKCYKGGKLTIGLNGSCWSSHSIRTAAPRKQPFHLSV